MYVYEIEEYKKIPTKYKFKKILRVMFWQVTY